VPAVMSLTRFFIPGLSVGSGGIPGTNGGHAQIRVITPGDGGGGRLGLSPGTGEMEKEKKKNGTITCFAPKARIRATGRQFNKVGQPGGFNGPYVKPPILVEPKSVAIIVNQFGPKALVRKFRKSIRGVTPGGQEFFGASDTIGFSPLPDGFASTEEFLKHQDGADVLFLELTDPEAHDEGFVPLTFQVAAQLGCPENSHPVQ